MAAPGQPARPIDELGGVLEFMRLLWAVDHGLQLASKRMRATLGVTGPQRLVVRLLGRFPRASAGELASTLHIHPSTLTGVLQRLESKRLIQREVDPEDARRARFFLTARGKKVDLRQGGTVESVVRRVLERVPEGELDGARSLLRRLAEELERGAKASD